MLELEAGSQVDRQPAVVRTVCRRPPSLGVQIIKISIGVLLSGHAWLQQQAAFSFLLHLSALKSTEVGTPNTDHGGARCGLPSLSQHGQLPEGRKCAAMEALQAAKHLTPHTSHQPIFVSGCQSHHLDLHTNTAHPSLSPGAMLSYSDL